MSVAAVLQGALQELREGDHKLDNPPLTLSNSGLQPGGRPPPMATDTYIAVDGGGSTNPGDPAQDHIKERYTVSVYVSRKTGRMPQDRLMNIYLEERSGLERIERQIKRALHGQVSTLAAMNSFLDEDVQEFLETLWWVRSHDPQPMSGEWSGDAPEAKSWLVQKIDFVGALRVQDARAVW